MSNHKKIGGKQEIEGLEAKLGESEVKWGKCGKVGESKGKVPLPQIS